MVESEVPALAADPCISAGCGAGPMPSCNAVLVRHRVMTHRGVVMATPAHTGSLEFQLRGMFLWPGLAVDTGGLLVCTSPLCRPLWHPHCCGKSIICPLCCSCTLHFFVEHLKDAQRLFNQ